MTGSAPECVAPAEGLRDVRARTGLSLAALAERTAYSKSSWERYVNGKKPVPRQAVEALCAIAGEPPGRLLALWELADAEWSGRARQTRPAAPPLSAPAPAGAGGTTGADGRAPRRRLFTVGVADRGVYRFTPMVGAPDRTGPRLCFVPASGTGRECFDR
ncbi:helix-turn-helix domain-containing protein [Streptomyces sparsogenes]|uniref:helix-turn-helix domain-containing protein n=1 Tax=Streptomyces sparsogenes TaxID=67365 RepID=UPI0033F878FF